VNDEKGVRVRLFLSKENIKKDKEMNRRREKGVSW